MVSEGRAIAEAPAISILIATYDRPASLVRCLSSLTAQQCKHSFEIIVVDNHPQSGITTGLIAQFSEVRWLQEESQGLARARNRAIGAARGEILVTTDDDVVAPPEWLELLTEPLFNRDGGLVATTGNCLPWKVETEAEALFEAYGGLRHGDDPQEFDSAWMASWRICCPQLWRIGTTANAAFRRSIFSDPAIGLLETRLGAGTPAGAWEDLYFFYRILLAGHRIAYLPHACVLHAHRESMSEVVRQLNGYRRGETAFLALILFRHHDWRAIGQAFFWIPRWRFALLGGELLRRARGAKKFSFRAFWGESLAYLAGPWSLLPSRNERNQVAKRKAFLS